MKVIIRKNGNGMELEFPDVTFAELREIASVVATLPAVGMEIETGSAPARPGGFGANGNTAIGTKRPGTCRKCGSTTEGASICERCIPEQANRPRPVDKLAVKQKLCLDCGNPTGRNGNAKRCEECRRAKQLSYQRDHTAKPLRQANCQFCGVEFGVKPGCTGKYCSLSCVGKARAGRTSFSLAKTIETPIETPPVSVRPEHLDRYEDRMDAFQAALHYGGPFTNVACPDCGAGLDVQRSINGAKEVRCSGECKTRVKYRHDPSAWTGLDTISRSDTSPVHLERR